MKTEIRNDPQYPRATAVLFYYGGMLVLLATLVFFLAPKSAEDSAILVSAVSLVAAIALFGWALDRQYGSGKACRERIKDQKLLFLRLVSRDQAREGLKGTAERLQKACERNAQLKWELSRLNREPTLLETASSNEAGIEVERLKKSFWWMLGVLKEVDETFDFTEGVESFKDLLQDEEKDPAA